MYSTELKEVCAQTIDEWVRMYKHNWIGLHSLQSRVSGMLELVANTENYWDDNDPYDEILDAANETLTRELGSEWRKMK